MPFASPWKRILVFIFLFDLCWWEWIKEETTYTLECRKSESLTRELQNLDAQQFSHWSQDDQWSPSNQQKNSVIYLHWPHPGKAEPQFVDREFGLSFGAEVISVRREAEICHWMEWRYSHQADDDGDDDDHTHAIRYTYHYVLGWHSSPIMSAFFDQPLLYHNPSRPEFFSSSSIKTWWADSASLGDYRLPAEMMRSANLPLKVFDHFHPDQLDHFRNSTMAERHNMRYVGNGYFYSPHVPTFWENVALGLGVFTSLGSPAGLFDHQLYPSLELNKLIQNAHFVRG